MSSTEAVKHPAGSYRTDIIVEVDVVIRVLDMGDGDLPLQAKQRMVLGYGPNEDIRDQAVLAARKMAEDLAAMAEPIAFKLAVRA